MYERKDAFYKKAKREGYRARSAYKLIELNQEFRFLRPSMGVVDLGAWPGGWVQVAAEIVGRSGKVVGIDLVALEPFPFPQVTLLHGDATDPVQQERILTALGGPAEVLLSDMAPKLSGIKEVDEVRSMELCRLALASATTLLRPGGALLLKVFMGSEYKAFLAEVRALFSAVKTTKPESSRKGSAETYVFAAGLKKG
ncbi:MAG: RlmE family RNA methyltransferase [Deltaproteobacteria bacterium]|nr:RlmE family RNA methyltransferase [Deltaproteobacteria bacterium]